MEIGDSIIYRTKDIQSQLQGMMKGKIKTGIIEEIFDSMDKSFECFWIQGEKELIIESQIISVK